MEAVGNTVIIKLVKEKVTNGEKVMDNGLIAIGGDSATSTMDILAKWEGEVTSVGDEVNTESPIKVGGIIRITENSGIPIDEEETDTEQIRYVSVRYGDILAVM